jgi:hypothetical protein
VGTIAPLSPSPPVPTALKQERHAKTNSTDAVKYLDVMGKECANCTQQWLGMCTAKIGTKSSISIITKGQKISKAIYGVLNFPKNERYLSRL